MPTEAIEATEREAEATDLGSLIDFNPHDDEERPPDPGVYVFYDVSQRPVYVGESSNIRMRVRGHVEKFWFKRPIVESAAYIRISDQKLGEQIEQIWIRFLKSNAVMNRQHVVRERAVARSFPWGPVLQRNQRPASMAPGRNWVAPLRLHLSEYFGLGVQSGLAALLLALVPHV